MACLSDLGRCCMLISAGILGANVGSEIVDWRSEGRLVARRGEAVFFFFEASIFESKLLSERYGNSESKLVNCVVKRRETQESKGKQYKTTDRKQRLYGLKERENKERYEEVEARQ